MASLLVIGGSGFFGKSILDAYRRRLFSLREIERIEIAARNATNLATSNPELISESVFLCDLDITRCSYLPKADYVIHAAASTDSRNYLLRSHQERKNIQMGASHFCNLVKQFLPKSKIIYVSTGAIYGQQPSEIANLDEDFLFQNLTALELGKRDYAAAKRDGERYIQELGRDGYSVAIARCFAFVGAYLPRNQHFAIGNFIEDGLRGRPIIVKAQRPVYRSYLYADDLVSWLMTLLKKADPKCPVINVGSDESILVGDLAKKVANYFGVQAKIPQFSNQMIDRYVPSIQRALHMGCVKSLCLDSAIAETIQRINHCNEKDS